MAETFCYEVIPKSKLIVSSLKKQLYGGLTVFYQTSYTTHILNLPSVKRIMLTSLTKQIESGIPSPRTMKTSLANSNWAFLYLKNG